MNLTELPNEIIHKIFSNLSFYDLITTTEVCKSFSNSFTFCKAARVTISHHYPITQIKLENQVDLEELFLKSTRNYHHFSIINSTIAQAVIKKFGPQIKSIGLELRKEAKIELQEFLSFLNSTPTVEEIRIEHGLKMTSIEELEFPKLKHVKTFLFSQKLLNEDLDLFYDFIKELTKQMKLETLVISPSESMSQAFINKIYSLENLFKNVKQFEFTAPESIEQLARINKAVKVIKLTDMNSKLFSNLDTRNDILDLNLEKFLYKANNCVENEDVEKMISSICSWKSYRNLKTLAIESLKNVPASSLRHLNKLKHLRALLILNVNDSLLNFEEVLLPNLKKLTIDSPNIEASTLKQISNQFLNLTTLDLSYCCKFAVNNQSVDLICQKLLLLQELLLESCFEITDDAFESINNLVKLKKLDLNDCIEVEGKFVKNLFLPDMERLSLFSVTEKTSAEDFLNLAKNCPKIKVLCLGYNESINDEKIEIVSKNCGNLLYLSLLGIHNITDTSIENIAKNCTNLKILEIIDCIQITVNAKYIYKNMPRLRQLEYIN